MIAHRENEYINTAVADRVHQAVFVSNSAAPFAVLALQRLRFANSRKRMLLYVFKQSRNAFENTLITLAFPIVSILPGSFEKNYFHKSSIAMGLKLPSAISFSPWRRISTISGEDMIYSVSSIFCFWAVIFLRAFMAFFIMPSSSEMMLSSRNSSAFNCSVVITSFI